MAISVMSKPCLSSLSFVWGFFLVTAYFWNYLPEVHSLIVTSLTLDPVLEYRGPVICFRKLCWRLEYYWANMRRKRKEDDFHPKTLMKYSGTVWKMLTAPDWWICIVYLTGRRREKKDRIHCAKCLNRLLLTGRGRVSALKSPLA